MMTNDELTRRLIIDPAKAEAKLLQAAIDYAEAISEALKAKQIERPPFDRRI